MSYTKSGLFVLGLGLLIALAAIACTRTEQSTTTGRPAASPVVSKEGEACLACHRSATPGIVNDWLDSKHAPKGTDCWTCHEGEGDRPDIVEHNGYRIVVLVTPQDCEGCHATQAEEFLASRHSEAAVFIGSLDNILGEIIGGGPAANAGCKQCHGSTVAVKDGKLDSTTWPNTGIGRINPDDSHGTCSACHSRHIFSVAQARQPEICGKCHLGPDHPQMEVWQESKHGARYYEATQAGQTLNIGLPGGQWMPGRDYSAGPTCASCHMSATPGQGVTHDVGARLSWTLRPAVSTKLPDWEKKRSSMQDVCRQCHSSAFTAGFYDQFDAVVNLYNDKFGKPAKEIMDRLTEKKLLTTQPFDAQIKWTYYELWHHEGRRARHGASMAGPDYTWWHGLYEVAKHFYNEFVPEARELDSAIVDDVLSRLPEHDWFTKGMSPEMIQEILDFYKERYGQ